MSIVRNVVLKKEEFLKKMPELFSDLWPCALHGEDSGEWYHVAIKDHDLQLNGTYFRITFNTERTSRLAWYTNYDDKIHFRGNVITFEEILAQIPEYIKIKLLYHLDLLK